REHDEAILLPLALLNAQQHALAVDIGDLQRDDLGYAQARAIGHAERRPIFYAGGGGEKSSHLLRAQNDWNPARLAHQRQTPDQIVPFERHFEKEPQRDDRCVDDPRAHMGLRHVLLKQTKVLGAGGIGRTAEESREALDDGSAPNPRYGEPIWRRRERPGVWDRRRSSSAFRTT